MLQEKYVFCLNLIPSAPYSIAGIFYVPTYYCMFALESKYTVMHFYQNSSILAVFIKSSDFKIIFLKFFTILQCTLHFEIYFSLHDFMSHSLTKSCENTPRCGAVLPPCLLAWEFPSMNGCSQHIDQPDRLGLILIWT